MQINCNYSVSLSLNCNKIIYRSWVKKKNSFLILELVKMVLYIRLSIDLKIYSTILKRWSQIWMKQPLC